METPIHTEKQTMPLRTVLLLVIAAVFLFGTWQSRHELPAMIVLAVMIPVAVVVVWGFTELGVVVTPSHVRFGFPFFRKTFAVRDIRVGEIQKISFLAGLGIHYWAGKWVFNARFGRGVCLSARGKEYLIGSDEPERLQNALLQVAPRRGTP